MPRQSGAATGAGHATTLPRPPAPPHTNPVVPGVWHQSRPTVEADGEAHSGRPVTRLGTLIAAKLHAGGASALRRGECNRGLGHGALSGPVWCSCCTACIYVLQHDLAASHEAPLHAGCRGHGRLNAERACGAPAGPCTAAGNQPPEHARDSDRRLQESRLL